jgi:hypothetical protein
MNLRDARNPYKTTGKLIDFFFFCILLVFTYLDSEQVFGIFNCMAAGIFRTGLATALGMEHVET